MMTNLLFAISQFVWVGKLEFIWFTDIKCEFNLCVNPWNLQDCASLAIGANCTELWGIWAVSRLGNEVALQYGLVWSALVGTSCCSLSASPLPVRGAGVMAKICGYRSGMRVKEEDLCWGNIWNSLIFDVFSTNWRCSHIEIQIICQFGVSYFWII